ncbi:hypothetical protein EVAR_75693_1 [Eumeta japonica]|uniref:Uncharacterized protein n=1 Tax=Eumeta variegata TaxID=151549 RepID=A0A4C1W3Z2_EUMVA|nr:hypothetical protein EVAR_75693_1 [Eumeta japonica]
MITTRRENFNTQKKSSNTLNVPTIFESIPRCLGMPFQIDNSTQVTPVNNQSTSTRNNGSIFSSFAIDKLSGSICTAVLFMLGWKLLCSKRRRGPESRAKTGNEIENGARVEIQIGTEGGIDIDIVSNIFPYKNEGTHSTFTGAKPQAEI